MMRRIEAGQTVNYRSRPALLQEAAVENGHVREMADAGKTRCACGPLLYRTLTHQI